MLIAGGVCGVRRWGVAFLVGHFLSSAHEAQLAFTSIMRTFVAVLFIGSSSSYVFCPTVPKGIAWALLAGTTISMQVWLQEGSAPCPLQSCPLGVRSMWQRWGKVKGW